MHKPVQLLVKSQQSVDGVPQEPIVLETSGSMHIQGDTVILRYAEAATSDEARALTSIYVYPNQRSVDIHRRGEAQYRLRLKEGEIHPFLYEMENGSLSLSAAGKTFAWKMDGQDGKLHIVYTLGDEAEAWMETELTIEIHEIMDRPNGTSSD